MGSLSLLKPSFIPRLRSSFAALLGISEAAPAAVRDRTEDIRALMLSEIGECGENKFPVVARRVRYAPDVQGLWYARSDVMAILASTHGETVAREKIANISEQFKGLLPESLTGRISSYSR